MLVPETLQLMIRCPWQTCRKVGLCCTPLKLLAVNGLRVTGQHEERKVWAGVLVGGRVQLYSMVKASKCYNCSLAELRPVQHPALAPRASSDLVLARVHQW